ncbi:transcriptional regulator with PAS, ATPase and Fis domain [Paenochrobactrum gallinarii]|uniref:Transcriptional regulator with PAS, ATPase and Fis domain n=1 Tax=Paenochrobactrum gallinarii TaxID=643673 RepID=A0A841LUX4_9HYPH|nr:sigma-54 dependent transcriptional regulator [Paenochrobactrum gallinarii]MBB6261933.1 transcriptional regulator with PAS, ATPase and Fis domain [Paenochrobactrum gallinarii]
MEAKGSGVASYQGQLIGEHHSIEATRRLITRVAKSPTRTVLIYGETGTGKGLVARMLHQQSSRAAHEFVDVNCAAIPDNLLESELFGYERGAFTGATAKKTGLVETANQGSIFLDEIREMDLVLQAKLLSLLDTQRFRRVGAVQPIDVDVRFITATNKILLAEVDGGRFREDLYYRLQVIAINIPPLRERDHDVLILTQHFLKQLNERYKRNITGISAEVAQIFRDYPWPGNVRELENLLERIFILEDENEILLKHLPDRIIRGARNPRHVSIPQSSAVNTENAETNFHIATQQFQKSLIERALSKAQGNIGQAAADLDISRHALRHHMIKLNISTD